MQVVLYTRVSLDPTGEGASTQRQSESCRAYAVAKGWEVIDEFRDADYSAYGSLERPAFELLLDAIDRGWVQLVLAWKLDRLVRKPADFERFWARCERNGVGLASVTEPIDTSTNIGLAMVRVMVTFAGLESATRSERLRAYWRSQRLKGFAPTFGRGYGYRMNHELIPEEAAYVRWAVDELLAGASLQGTARALTANGSRTAKGNPWRVDGLRKVVLAPRIAGLLTYHDEVVGAAPWEPIIDAAAFAQLQFLLADPTRRRRVAFPGGPAHLLTGFVRCSRCGTHLLHRRSSRRARRYHCPNNCTGIDYDFADAVIAAEIVAHLRRLRSRTQTRQGRAKRQRTDCTELTGQLAGRLREAAREYYVERAVTRAEYLEIRDELRAQLARADSLAALAPVGAVLDLLGRDPAQGWRAADLATRRRALEMLVDHIDVLPAPRHGSKTPSAGRLVIYFVGTDEGHPATATQFVTAPRRRRAPSSLLGTNDVARQLRLSREAIIHQIRLGHLKAHKTGREWSVLQSDLDEFVQEHRIEPTSAELRPAPERGAAPVVLGNRDIRALTRARAGGRNE